MLSLFCGLVFVFSNFNKIHFFRYFFKTECEDLDMIVIQEEVTDDNDVLPLYEGKIMAQVKSADWTKTRQIITLPFVLKED